MSSLGANGQKRDWEGRGIKVFLSSNPLISYALGECPKAPITTPFELLAVKLSLVERGETGAGATDIVNVRGLR